MAMDYLNYAENILQKLNALSHKIWEVEGKHERARLFANPVYVSGGF